jgi:GTP-binding protein
MAKLPTVAIIGRPNTGKSTLFNRMVGKRRAIVSDIAGTTRDHVVYRVENDEMDYLLLDTGGMGGGSSDTDFEDDVAAQSLIALGAADLILFTINSREELTSSDFNVVDILRKQKRRHVPVIIVLTKCDNFMESEEKMPQYYSLGLTDSIVAVSSVHGLGIGELEDTLIEKLKELHFKKEEMESNAERAPRIALVGKPNVGKSSIVNALMSDPQRSLSARIVSEIPGTTRDSSDSIIMNDGKEYVFVDTAGLRRKSRVDEDLESISAIKSIQAVQDSDITVITIEANDVVSKQDKRIGSIAIEEGKGLILLINKADLLTAEERKEKEAEVRAEFRFCKYAPVLFVSALSRDGLLKLFPLLDTVYRNLHRRIPTKDLLRWFEGVVHRIPARELGRSKFITQADGTPPSFVIFVRKPKDVDVSQLRYLDNSFRDTFAFEGAPIRWITKAPEETDRAQKHRKTVEQRGGLRED